MNGKILNTSSKKPKSCYVYKQIYIHVNVEFFGSFTS